MADNEEENLNIQFPVDEDGNVADFPTQATFHADPTYIRVDPNQPWPELQTLLASVRVIISVDPWDWMKVNKLAASFIRLIDTRKRGEEVLWDNIDIASFETADEEVRELVMPLLDNALISEDDFLGVVSSLVSALEEILREG